MAYEFKLADNGESAMDEEEEFVLGLNEVDAVDVSGVMAIVDDG